MEEQKFEWREDRGIPSWDEGFTVLASKDYFVIIWWKIVAMKCDDYFLRDEDLERCRWGRGGILNLEEALAAGKII